MATLAHVLQLVGGWIAPLVIFLVKRNSRFVSFHALQALLLQGLYFFFMIISMTAFFAVAIAGFAFHQPAQHSLPPAFVSRGVARDHGLVDFCANSSHRIWNQGWARPMG
ncbi:MAG: DUF4870 domain-containing protein [Candidatus Sulfotelmatobacter sp.]